jgi:hypothetical protein
MLAKDQHLKAYTLSRCRKNAKSTFLAHFQNFKEIDNFEESVDYVNEKKVHFKKFLNSLDQLELEKAASKELS